MTAGSSESRPSARSTLGGRSTEGALTGKRYTSDIEVWLFGREAGQWKINCIVFNHKPTPH
jgi:hypothetical protein